MPGLFVTGTDTDVGKTFVSCAIVRGLRDAGVDVGVMKPAETGVPPEGPLDVRALIAAAGVDDTIEEVCPFRFDVPAAPLASARAEAREIDPARIAEAYDVLAARHAFMLVEGAGGLYVPVTETLDMIDLIGEMGLPLLLVARAALGTINHTLLSIEACERRGLAIAGVVISHAGGVLSDADAQNLVLLRERLGARLIGEVFPGDDPTKVDPRDAGLDAVLALARRATADDAPAR